MVVVNSGGVSEGVFESELFGHVRGAFTDAKADRVGRFELADQGTLFLDEIANVPLSQQNKLLRVIETESSSASDLRARGASMSGSFRPPTPISPKRSRPGDSGRICSSASTPSKSACRRCATGAKTRRYSPSTSCGSTRSAIASG